VKRLIMLIPVNLCDLCPNFMAKRDLAVLAGPLVAWTDLL